MAEVPRQCQLSEYCRKIKNNQVPLDDESAKAIFVRGFRRQYRTDEVYDCWLMNSRSCAMDPQSWVSLGSRVQAFMWTIANPLE